MLVEVGEFMSRTWAFCFRTSAGVRIAQETISPREEERAWIRGVGRGWVNGRGFWDEDWD